MPIDAAQVKWDEPQSGGIDASKIQWDEPEVEQEKPSALMAIPAGINTLLPSVLGMPMDTATNVANLGIAGYGAIKGALGGKDLPDTLPPQPGGSQWFANKISGALGEDVFSNPRPDSTAAQMLHTGAAVTSGAMLNPASGVKQAASNIARMIPSGVGAAIGEQVSDNPLAPAIGALVAPTAAAGINAIRAKSPVVSDAFSKARKHGYVVPPSEVDPSLKNVALESVSGKAATNQSASIRNQRVTNKLASEEISKSADKLGIKFDGKKPLTEQALSEVRAEAGKVYRDIKNHGETIIATNDYLDGVKSLAGDFQAAAKEFPDIINNKEIIRLQQSLSVGEMSPTAAVELSKKLRFDGGKNLKAFDDPERAALGTAQRKAANLVEELVQSNLDTTGKSMLGRRWKEARSLIAKTYDVESALNNTTGNVDARVFGKMLDKDRPLTGGFQSIAEFAEAFPKSVQDPSKFGSPGVSKLQAATSAMLGAGGGFATGGPGAVAGAIPLVAPPAARARILSQGYQDRLANGSKTYQAPKGLAAGLAIEYQDQAKDLKKRMAEIKASDISNRQKREQLQDAKKEINSVFRDARKNLEHDEFLELRDFVEDEEE